MGLRLQLLTGLAVDLVSKHVDVYMSNNSNSNNNNIYIYYWDIIGIFHEVYNKHYICCFVCSVGNNHRCLYIVAFMGKVMITHWDWGLPVLRQTTGSEPVKIGVIYEAK